MKELSIEEKAKAYDKVREKIELRFGSNVAEEIFSQFEDSEDERIRKEIIDYCYERLNTSYGALPKIEAIKRWLVWLEKQGQTFTNKDIDDAYLKGVCDAKQELEKQDEQKPILDFKASNWYVSKVDGKIHDMTYNPANKVEPKVGEKIEDEIEIPFGAKDSELQEEIYFIPKGFHAEIEDNKVIIKKGEKSTAWSEEDEDVINHLLAICAGAKKYRQFAGCLQEDITKYQTWLKYLKNRVQLQSEVE